MTDDEYDQYFKLMDSPTGRRILEEGELAYNKWHCNKPFDDCPYEKGTFEEGIWLDGWSREKGH